MTFYMHWETKNSLGSLSCGMGSVLVARTELQFLGSELSAPRAEPSGRLGASSDPTPQSAPFHPWAAQHF